MYNEGGLLVATGTATSSDPTRGFVDYDFQAADVADAGTFYAFIEVSNGSNPPEKDTYPEDGVGIKVIIFDEGSNRNDPTPSIDIIDAANSPARVRTVEGTVEERPIPELIKADQYAATKAAAQAGAVPWGIRCARIRPPSTTDRRAAQSSPDYPYPY